MKWNEKKTSLKRVKLKKQWREWRGRGLVVQNATKIEMLNKVSIWILAEKSNKTGFRKTNFATTPSFNEKIVLIVLEREGKKIVEETEIRT